ncbi:MAG TPA: hypothetical protein VJ935_13175 [Acidimicrobiia bacterium]|nr:hypothetical protein [Acidimicrobiia bacterium]
MNKILARYEETTRSLIGDDAFESALGRGAALTDEEVRALISEAITQGIKNLFQADRRGD